MPRHYPKKGEKQLPDKSKSIGVTPRPKRKRGGLKSTKHTQERGPRGIYVRRSKVILAKMRELYDRLTTIRNDLNISNWRTLFTFLVDELWSRGEIQVDAEQVLGSNAHVPVYEDFLRSMPCAICHKEPPAHGTPLMFFDDLGTPLFEEPREYVVKDRGNSWNALPICKECWKDPAQRINITRMTVLYLQNAYLRLFFSLLFSRKATPRSITYSKGVILKEVPEGDESEPLVKITDQERRKWLYDSLKEHDEGEPEGFE